MKVKLKLDEKEIIREYKETAIGIESLARKHNVGKLKIKEILDRNGIVHKGRGKQVVLGKFVIEDASVEKYKPVEGKHYVAVSKNGSGFSTTDIGNRGGVLTTYIRNELNTHVPSLAERNLYYKRTGDYWWEQFFDVILVDDRKTKKCPYCGWKTNDIDNRSGAFSVHIANYHNKTIEDYIYEYPDDIDYFNSYKSRKKHEKDLNTNSTSVLCPICNTRFKMLAVWHIEKHGMSWSEFREKYRNIELLSDVDKDKARKSISEYNKDLTKSNFSSQSEREIAEYIKSLGFEVETNRQMLIGKEIDILIQSEKIGIEFNGNLWHSEFFGKKDKNYHLAKTMSCNAKGYSLIHIFEDEYENNKRLVLSKIRHILHKDYDLERIMGRKVCVREISKETAKEFLDKNHIQGFVNSTIHYGAFYKEVLVAAMSFKKCGNDGMWELTRFAGKMDCRLQGVGGKMFSFFVNEKSPVSVKSFADRRWTVNKDNNLYTSIGFIFDGYTKPDYKYYNEKVDRYKRFHKFNFRKEILHRKYDLDMSLTETEMIKKLGYDRIWDCGLIRYVWRKNESKKK